MVCTLVQLMRTLDRMPEEKEGNVTNLFNLQPVDYEPPFFRSCTEEEAHISWNKNPLKMEVGNVNRKHLVLALKVKSVLDPCEDENEDIQDDNASLGADSVQRDGSSESDSEIQKKKMGQFLVSLCNIQCCGYIQILFLLALFGLFECNIIRQSQA